jgi:hypothetical protein
MSQTQSIKKIEVRLAKVYKPSELNEIKLRSYIATKSGRNS